MTRICIRLPSQFAFSTDITLYQSHLNYGGHLDRKTVTLAGVKDSF